MDAGEIEAAILIGVNPVYDAPADIDFGAALEKVGLVVSHGLYADETAEKAQRIEELLRKEAEELELDEEGEEPDSDATD